MKRPQNKNVKICKFCKYKIRKFDILNKKLFALLWAIFETFKKFFKKTYKKHLTSIKYSDNM